MSMCLFGEGTEESKYFTLNAISLLESCAKVISDQGIMPKYQAIAMLGRGTAETEVKELR